MDAPVLFRTEGAVGVITLNRPDNRNSMTPDLLDEFDKIITVVANDRSLRAVVIHGAGRCFCAGADFKACVQRGGPLALPNERSFSMYEPFLRLLDIDVPIVGALNGHAVGGGFGLALLCDLRYSNRDAKYGANFARLGLSSGMAISVTLPRIVGHQRASEMLYTGRLWSGVETETIGLALAALPPEEVVPTAMATARSIAENAPLAVRDMKKLMCGHDRRAVRAVAQREAFFQAKSLQTEDAAEGMSALLEKRVPSFKGR